jgi:hypothetical protein
MYNSSSFDESVVASHTRFILVCFKMDPQNQQVQSSQQTNQLVFKYIIIGPTGVGTSICLLLLVSSLVFWKEFNKFEKVFAKKINIIFTLWKENRLFFCDSQVRTKYPLHSVGFEVILTKFRIYSFNRANISSFSWVNNRGWIRNLFHQNR